MPERKERGISEKQEKFILEYLRTNNAYASAKAVGYCPSYATNLLQKKQIQERVEQLKEKIEISDMISVEFVVSGIVEVYTRCLGKEPKMTYNKIKHCSEQAKDKDGNLMWTFDSSGALKALDMLARYVGLFSQDNMQRQIIANKSTGAMSDAQFADLLKNLAPTIINEKIEISTKPKKENAKSQIN